VGDGNGVGEARKQRSRSGPLVRSGTMTCSGGGVKAVVFFKAGSRWWCAPWLESSTTGGDGGVRGDWGAEAAIDGQGLGGLENELCVGREHGV
jgi:hypothetical protein